MTLMKLRLELAREPEHPAGSPLHGFEIVAPLNADGLLDLDEWRDKKSHCLVRRFWQGEGDRHGTLTHNGSHWRFHYAETPEDDDEDVFRLGAHKLLVGEYISVTEDDGEEHTFRVVHAEALPT